MNEMENFLNFGAVVKLRRSYDDDLFKFIELMKSVGFLQEYAEHFEKNCCFDKEYKEFSEEVFWHNVRKNGGNTNDICIEFQWGKGFAWGERKEYSNYDSEMKILNIDELIRACNKEHIFKMNYEYTYFRKELLDKESASRLDDFLVFYEWSIVKYPDGKYNIKDEQCNTFDFEENTTLDKVIKRVYFRMFDYFMDEEDIEELMKEDSNYVRESFEKYIKVGENLHLLDEVSKKCYYDRFKEITEEKELTDSIEFNNDI